MTDPDTASDGVPYVTDEQIEAVPGAFWFVLQPGWTRDNARRAYFGPAPYAPPPLRRTDYGRDEA